MNLGVTIPFPDPMSDLRSAVEALDQAGYTGLWTAETSGADAFSPLLLASAHGDARLGTAIASVYARSPALLAMSSAALAEAAPGRATVGLGASSAAMAERWHDRPYTAPRQRVIDTVRFLQTALRGERVKETFPTFSVQGFQLERPPEVPPSLLIAALGPKMLAAAGAEADGVTLNWLGATDVAKTASRVEDARAPDAGPPEVAARIFVCPTTDPATARRAAKAIIATYLTVPVYEAYHRWLGRTEQLSELWDRWRQRDRDGAIASVPDHVVDELIGLGTPAVCAAHVRDYVDAGVTSPIVKVLPLDPGVDPLTAACAVARAVTGRP